MCLEIRKKRNRIQRVFNLKEKPLIAKKDIECYKIYNKIDSTLYESIVQGSQHLLGIQPEVELGINYSDYRKYTEINEGYHSYIEKPSMRYQCETSILIKCIIPKGAKYFIGHINHDEEINGYVSNIIILKEEIHEQFTSRSRK